MVTLYVPKGSVFALFKVTTLLPLPGAAIGFVPKVTVVPAGTPDADKVIAELKVPVTAVVTVAVDVVLVPQVIADGAVEEIVKSFSLVYLTS